MSTNPSPSTVEQDCTRDGKPFLSPDETRRADRLVEGGIFQVLATECQQTYLRFLHDLVRQFTPTNHAENAVVERMAEHEWMRRRALSYQETLLVDRVSFNITQFALFERYGAHHERAYNTCLKQLLTLRAALRSEQIGFVRQNHQTQQIEWQKQRHETAQKVRHVDTECKIARTLSAVAHNPEAAHVVKEAQARFQAA